MQPLATCLAIGVAGFCGALARYGVNLVAARTLGTGFPVGILFINVSGSFALGWFLTFAADRWSVSDTTRLAVATGFLGAYTTFSTLMYDTHQQWETAQRGKAVLNLVGSVALGLLAVKLGVWAARR